MTERHDLGYISTLSQAKIFDLPGRPQDFLSKEMEWGIVDFFLPFRTIAVEDTAGVVVLHDMDKGQLGNEVPRAFISASSTKTPYDNYDWSRDPDSDRAKRVAERQEGEEEVLFIAYGVIEKWFPNKEAPNSFDTVGVVYRYVVCSKEKIILDMDSNNRISKMDFEIIKRESLRNAMVAIQEVYYLNQPTYFIVEVSGKMKKEGKELKLLRSHQRPHYVHMRPGEVVKILKEGRAKGAESLPREPHWRRRHLRTFESNYFKKMKGKTINIPAVWIGPTEAVIGKKHYKVRLDL